MSPRGYRVAYDEDVRRIVATLPVAGTRAFAELGRELTRGAPLLDLLGVRPAGQEVAYASSHDLLVASRVDHEQRVIRVLSLVWLGADG